MFAGFRKIKCQKNDNLIVYVIIKFKPRYIKMAQALKKLNYKLVFIMRDSDFNKEKRKEVPRDIRVHYFHTPEEALHMCEKYNPLVFHIFVEKNYEVSCELIRNKHKLGKIVYSEYDLFWGYYKNSFKKSAERAVLKERYCLENADGICFRDWGGEFLEEKTDYNIAGRWILFLDGCSNIPVRKTQHLSDELHIVYAGEVRSEKQFKDKEDTRLLILAEKCEREKVHLHVYPTRKDHALYSTYIAMSNKMQYFHFYDPVPYSELIDKLSEYDYGIEPAGEKTEEKYVTEQSVIYLSGNKYFDYLDAELPIIAPVGKIMRKSLQEKGVAIGEDIMQVDFGWLKEKKAEFKKAVVQAKKDYAIDNNIQKLVEFYKEI